MNVLMKFLQRIGKPFSEMIRLFDTQKRSIENRPLEGLVRCAVNNLGSLWESRAYSRRTIESSKKKRKRSKVERLLSRSAFTWGHHRYNGTSFHSVWWRPFRSMWTQWWHVSNLEIERYKMFTFLHSQFTVQTILFFQTSLRCLKDVNFRHR